MVTVLLPGTCTHGRAKDIEQGGEGCKFARAGRRGGNMHCFDRQTAQSTALLAAEPGCRMIRPRGCGPGASDTCMPRVRQPRGTARHFGAGSRRVKGWPGASAHWPPDLWSLYRQLTARADGVRRVETRGCPCHDGACIVIGFPAKPACSSERKPSRSTQPRETISDPDPFRTAGEVWTEPRSAPGRRRPDCARRKNRALVAADGTGWERPA